MAVASPSPAVVSPTGEVPCPLSKGTDTPPDLRLAVGARLNFGIHVADDLPEDDVDPGPSFVSVTGRFTEFLTASFANTDQCNSNEFEGAHVAGASVVLCSALGVAAGCCRSAPKSDTRTRRDSDVRSR